MSDRVRWEDKVGQDALTFDDVLLVPAYSAIHPRDVDVRTRFSRRIALNLPVVSSAMDTVTEAELAIALAREGGLGVIHRNLTIAGQCAQVDRVKRSESGTIADPLTLSPSTTPGEASAVRSRSRVTGASIAAKDVGKRIRHPLACKDALGRLRVAAAVGTGGDVLERAAELVRSGVDALVVDSAHAHSSGVLKAAKAVRERFPDVDLVVGNVGTFEGARAVADLGADAVKVGMGPGAICTTRVVSGAGMAQITAVLEAARALEGRDLPIIADGGIKYSGDLVKALAAGAHSVMIGSLFAGTTESPGETVLLEGRSYKAYRGMGSLSAMAAAKGSRERYFQEDSDELVKLVPEGIEGRVPFRGPLERLVFQLVGGLRSGMGYCGVGSIEELRAKSRFVRISPAGLRESHPHDITITGEAPNYGEPGRP
jgi:IMP dehydrogenase